MAALRSPDPCIDAPILIGGKAEGDCIMNPVEARFTSPKLSPWAPTIAPPDTELFLYAFFTGVAFSDMSIGVPAKWLGCVMNFSLWPVIGVPILLTSCCLNVPK